MDAWKVWAAIYIKNRKVDDGTALLERLTELHHNRHVVPRGQLHTFTSALAKQDDASTSDTLEGSNRNAKHEGHEEVSLKPSEALRTRF